MEKIQQFKEKYPSLYNEFTQIQEEMLQTFCEKSLQYGVEYLPSEKEQEFRVNGILYRIAEKVQRLKTLIGSSSVNEVNESIEDTLQDLANYSIMLMMVRNDYYNDFK